MGGYTWEENELMHKQYIGIIVFSLLNVATALSFHYKIKLFFLSSILSAILASLLYQIIGFFVLGYLDPFFSKAFVNTLPISIFIALLVGIPFVYYRRKTKPKWYKIGFQEEIGRWKPFWGPRQSKRRGLRRGFTPMGKWQELQSRGKIWNGNRASWGRGEACWKMKCVHYRKGVKMKKMYLSDTDRKIGGVCGGIGEYFDKDPTLIRIIFILFILFSFGFGILAYLAMWLIMPKKPKDSQWYLRTEPFCHRF
jgi:phage shock protein C